MRELPDFFFSLTNFSCSPLDLWNTSSCSPLDLWNTSSCSPLGLWNTSSWLEASTLRHNELPTLAFQHSHATWAGEGASSCRGVGSLSVLEWAQIPARSCHRETAQLICMQRCRHDKQTFASHLSHAVLILVPVANSLRLGEPRDEESCRLRNVLVASSRTQLRGNPTMWVTGSTCARQWPESGRSPIAGNGLSRHRTSVRKGLPSGHSSQTHNNQKKQKCCPNQRTSPCAPMKQFVPITIVMTHHTAS